MNNRFLKHCSVFAMTAAFSAFWIAACSDDSVQSTHTPICSETSKPAGDCTCAADGSWTCPEKCTSPKPAGDCTCAADGSWTCSEKCTSPKPAGDCTCAADGSWACTCDEANKPQNATCSCDKTTGTWAECKCSEAPECESEGAQKCSNSGVLTCISDESGCMKWRKLTPEFTVEDSQAWFWGSYEHRNYEMMDCDVSKPDEKITAQIAHLYVLKIDLKAEGVHVFVTPEGIPSEGSCGDPAHNICDSIETNYCETTNCEEVCNPFGFMVTSVFADTAFEGIPQGSIKAAINASLFDKGKYDIQANSNKKIAGTYRAYGYNKSNGTPYKYHFATPRNSIAVGFKKDNSIQFFSHYENNYIDFVSHDNPKCNTFNAQFVEKEFDPMYNIVSGFNVFHNYTDKTTDYSPALKDIEPLSGFIIRNGRTCKEELETERDVTLCVETITNNEIKIPCYWIDNAGKIRIRDINTNKDEQFIYDFRVDFLGDSFIPYARTAIGTDKDKRYLYLIVVDLISEENEKGYKSRGMNIFELADVMKDMGIDTGIQLDSGGSSTMVVRGEDKAIQLMNHPNNKYTDSDERYVAVHLGIVVDDK